MTQTKTYKGIDLLDKILEELRAKQPETKTLKDHEREI